MNRTAGVEIIEALGDIRQLAGCKHFIRREGGHLLTSLSLSVSG